MRRARETCELAGLGERFEFLDAEETVEFFAPEVRRPRDGGVAGLVSRAPFDGVDDGLFLR